MQESETAIKNFYNALKAVDYLSFKNEEITLSESILEKKETFIQSMNDDFNTAKAVAVMFDLAKLIKSTKEDISLRKEASKLLIELGGVLGFFKEIEATLSNDLGDLSEKLLNIIID
ncbi:MAG: hypothetical protein B6226_05475, partial [Candidatus Cloacimonetes bacterium 4572_65]